MKRRGTLKWLACLTASILIWAPVSSAAEGLDIVLSPKDAANLFGSQKAKLLIKGEKGIYQVDFSKKPWTAELLVQPKRDTRLKSNKNRVTGEAYFGLPLISPDGSRFVYQDAGDITLARFEPGAPERTVLVEKADQPRWWIHPKTGEEYITYITRIENKKQKNIDTMIIKLEKGSCKADGAARILLKGHGMSGGRSPDGSVMVGTKTKPPVLYLKPLATENAFDKVASNQDLRTYYCSVSQNPREPLAILRDSRGRIWYRPFDAFHKHQLVNPEGFRSNSSLPEWSTHGDVATARLSNDHENAIFAYRFSWMNWKRLVNLRNGGPFGAVTSHLWIETGELPKRPAMELGKWEQYLYERLLTYAPKQAENGKKGKKGSKGKAFTMGLPSKRVGLSGIHEVKGGGAFLLRSKYEVFPLHFADLTPRDLLGAAKGVVKADDKKGIAATAYFEGRVAREKEHVQKIEGEGYLKRAGSLAAQVEKDLAAAKITYDGHRVFVGKRKGLGELVITKAQIARLFGGVKAKYVYLEMGKINHMTAVDFSKKEVKPERLFSFTYTNKSIVDPFISRDGTRVLYTDGDIIVVSELKAGAPGKTAVAEAGHYCPRWWYHPRTGEEYVIYVNKLSSQDSNLSGVTFMQKMKKGTCQPDGPPSKLMEKYAFRGGRSLDGKYICTALPGHALAELKPDALENAFVKMLFTSGRMCNPSISQDPERMMWWLWEDRGHSTVRYFVSPKRTGETICIPKGANQIQSLEWSTHPDFFTAYIYGGYPGDGGHGRNVRVRNMIYQWSTDKWITVLDRRPPYRVTNAQLWVDLNAKPVYPEKTTQERTIEAYDARLLAAAKAALAQKAHRGFKFRVDSLRPHSAWLMRVKENGQLYLNIGRTPTHIRPTGLSLLDKRSLAVSMAARIKEPEYQALAAFYTLAQKAYGKKESELRVQGLLALAGDEGKSILKEIKAADIQAPQMASLPNGQR